MSEESNSFREVISAMKVAIGKFKEVHEKGSKWKKKSRKK